MPLPEDQQTTRSTADSVEGPIPHVPPVEAGKEARPSGSEAHYDSGDHQHEPLNPLEFVRIAFVGLAACAVWFQIWEPFPKVSVIGLAATLIGGYPIFKEALSATMARRMTMELSMTIALVAALVIGEFFTVLVIVFFVLVAEVLERLTVGRGRRAIRDLLDLLPHKIYVRRAGEIQEVPAEDAGLNEIILVKPGARVPVDGVVIQGHSFVDQAAITGESLPVEKVPGAPVYAGTINQSGVLDVRITGFGRDTAFGKILEAVERAEKLKAPIQKTADRYAGYLVYFALTCAALTFLITRDARSTISVIIVAGACGIAAGTPLAILGAIGRAARQGAIIKGGIYLEVLGYVDTIVLDKTGTLTFGNPTVVSVRGVNGQSEHAVLEAAGIAERPSEHPLGKAIMKLVSEKGITPPEPERFEYLPGKGIRCSVNGDEILVGSRSFLEEMRVGAPHDGRSSPSGSEVLVARSGRLLGVLDIADTLRPEAMEAVTSLRRMKLRTILLTGDSATTAASVGKQLGVDEVQGELLPEEKLERVKALQAQSRKVAMVGDGINDAPALIQADVGIAVGTGTDVARESADVVLLGSDLLKLVKTLENARRCRRIIAANFAGTLIVDGVGVALAAFGLLNPFLAALIHVTSELAFILNSARLLPGRLKQSAVK